MINYNNSCKLEESEEITKKEVFEVAKYKIELNDNQQPIMVVEERITSDCLKLNSPNKIVDLINTGFNLNKLAEEHVYLIAVNTHLKPLGIFEVAHGQIDKCGISNREIFLRIFLCNAKYNAKGSFIIMHNHPSGVAKPSEGDFEICQRIKEAGALMGIPLYDFLIVAGEDSYSFIKNDDM